MMSKSVRHVAGLAVLSLVLSCFASAAHAFGIRAPFEVQRAPASSNSSASTGGGSTSGGGGVSTDPSAFKAYWEGKNVNAKTWTSLTQTAVSNYGTAMIKGTSDIATFCPQYDRLGTQDRINFWVQLLAAMTKYESGFDPTSWMTETGGGLDPVTGAQMKSEGLLQLSYADERNYKSVVPVGVCDFDYASDKQYPLKDVRRSIQDPKKNITCAVGILNHQLEKYNKIAVSSGAYWAVIKTDRSTNKLSEIRAITKSLAFCN